MVFLGKIVEVLFKQSGVHSGERIEIGIVAGPLNFLRPQLNQMFHMFDVSPLEQFITQGLITLNLSEANGTLKRDLLVWKMKQTPHSLKKHPFKIGKSGIEVSSKKKKSSSKRA